MNNGIAALRQHSTGKKHRSSSLHLWSDEKTVGTKVQAPLTNFITKVSGGQADTKKEQSEVDINNNEQNLTIPPPPTPSTSSSVTVEKWIGVGEQVAKAEALWTMKCATSNYSFSSSDKTPELFQNMFPDSIIAKNFSISHQKVSYLLSDGLGPYFQQSTVKDVLGSSAYFTIHFDETVSGQCKKQMDILIRYWSEKSACIQVHYLNSLFYGHAFAERVAKDLIDCMSNLKLPLSKLLCLSSDGPNVNKSIKSKIDNAVKEAGAPGLVDVGFCYIHTVHNAFKAGNQVFGMRALDFAMNVFYWFHMYPARDEDLKKIQKDENMENLKFLRHVDSRWLSLVPALHRIHEQLPAVKKYFLQYIPNHEKRSTNLKKFKDIHEALKRDESIIKVEMEFLQSVKPLFDSFLTVFQAEGPMVHVLYASLVDMLKILMNRFVKQDLIRGKSGPELAKLDINKLSNQQSDEEINIGQQTVVEMRNLTPLQRKECLIGMRNFFCKCTSYLQEKLPYSNKLLKSLSCLHPDQKDSSSRKIATVASELPCCSEGEISLVLDEWKIYQEIEIPKDCKESKEGIKNQVDVYWGKVFELKNPFGQPRFKTLPKVIKCALTLSHGNADTERSLSQNKKVVTKEKSSMSEKTLIGIRLTKDAVDSAGGQPSNVALTKPLLDCCSTAHKLYKAAIQERNRKEREEKRKEEQIQAERQQEEERLQKVKDLEKQNKDIDIKIKEIEHNLKSIDSLVTEANDRMSNAIKKKDMLGIEVAHELQDVAASKQKKAHSELEKMNVNKRKVTEKLEHLAKKKRKI
ncbi:MAG: hypothetical protein AB2693_29620 [Candidatus Thiodiazotropha sp.]